MAHKFGSSSGSGTYPYMAYLATRTGNPADSTTYYMGMNLAFTYSSSLVSLTEMISPVTGTLTTFKGRATVQGTLGSAQNVTVQIRVNNTVQASTTMQFTAAAQNVSMTGLTVSVTAGDSITITCATPAWTTNPTSVGFACSYIIS